MADTTTETPAGGETATGGAGTGAAPARPEWLSDDPHGFWDGEKGELKAETLYKSFEDTKRLIGARVSDLGPESRRKLAEMLPDTLKGTLESELRAKLGEDPEFLTPLQEKWRAENLRTPPETYDPPEVEGILSPDSPLYVKATDWAKKSGLDQDQFGEFMSFVTEAQNDREKALGGSSPEQWKEALPDIGPRASAVHNRLVALSSEAGAKKLLEWVREPEAFLALEAVVKATSSKPMALEGGTSEGEVTQAKLDEWMNDPKYYRDHDRDLTERVKKGFHRLYGDQL